MKEKQKKTKAFYLRNKESQKLLVERLTQEEVCLTIIIDLLRCYLIGYSTPKM